MFRAEQILPFEETICSGNQFLLPPPPAFALCAMSSQTQDIWRVPLPTDSARQMKSPEQDELQLHCQHTASLSSLGKGCHLQGPFLLHQVPMKVSACSRGQMCRKSGVVDKCPGLWSLVQDTLGDPNRALHPTWDSIGLMTHRDRSSPCQFSGKDSIPASLARIPPVAISHPGYKAYPPGALR